MESSREYQDAVTHALAGYQLIEEALKFYVEHYHEAVRALVGSHLSYLHSRREVEDASLGKLVGVFSKITSNTQLLQDLRSISSSREELAHRALTDLYGPDADDHDFSAKTDQYAGLAERLSQVLTAVHRETLNVRTVLVQVSQQQRQQQQ